MSMLYSRSGWTINCFFLCVFMLCSHMLISQQDRYLGTEKQITQEDLDQMMEEVSFGEAFSKQIHKDEKNTYFAFDASKLVSRFEKLRLIELIYDDTYLVNIGADPDEPFFFFLVNNVVMDEIGEVEAVFTEYATRAGNDYRNMSPEERQQWLLKHDKHKAHK